MEPKDYKTRSYLSAIEAAKYLGIKVETIHLLVKRNLIKAIKAASGQYRFDINELKEYEKKFKRKGEIKIKDKKKNKDFYLFKINVQLKKFL